MKYVTITTDYPPKKGGVARYTQALARFFGSDMHIVADIRPQPEDHDEQGAKVSYVPFMQKRWPYWMGAVRELEQHEAHAIFVQHVLPLGLAAHIHWRRTGVPYIVFLHGMDFSLATRNAWKRHLTKRVLRHAHTVVTNSQALRNDVETFCDVTPVVCYPMPGMMPAVAPKRLSPDGRTIELLSVARLVERKGIQRVLRVVANSPELRAGTHYTIVGAPGDYEKQLQRMVTDLGLYDTVTIVRDASETELVSAYERADVFVLPTLVLGEDREGFGIAYLEAAGFGLPSIASKLPGVNEAVLDQETGVLVDNDEELRRALLDLVENHERRKTLGEASRARVETQFTPEIVYADLVERLRSV